MCQRTEKSYAFNKPQYSDTLFIEGTVLSSADCIERFLYPLVICSTFWLPSSQNVSVLPFRFFVVGQFLTWTWQSNKSTWKSSKRNNSEDLFHWNGCNESICESFRRSVYLEVSCWFTFSLFCFLRLLLAWKSFSYLGYSRNPNQQMKEKILLRRMLVKREDQVQT